jgi:hypothetical protein
MVQSQLYTLNIEHPKHAHSLHYQTIFKKWHSFTITSYTF